MANGNGGSTWYIKIANTILDKGGVVGFIAIGSVVIIGWMFYANACSQTKWVDTLLDTTVSAQDRLSQSQEKMANSHEKMAESLEEFQTSVESLSQSVEKLESATNEARSFQQLVVDQHKQALDDHKDICDKLDQIQK
jgi:methyl-accepting chemotaxis protein